MVSTSRFFSEIYHWRYTSTADRVNNLKIWIRVNSSRFGLNSRRRESSDLRLTNWYIWGGINAVVHRRGFKTAHYEFHDKGKIKPRKFPGRENNFHSFRDLQNWISRLPHHEQRKESKKITRQRIFRRSGPSVWNVRGAVRTRPHVTYELWHFGIMRSRSRSWSGAMIGSNVDRNKTAGV